MSQPPALDSVYKLTGPVVMGVFLGYYLDQFFDTRPWGLLGMIFLGLATGFWSILRPLYFPDNAPKSLSPEKPDMPPRSEKTETD